MHTESQNPNSQAPRNALVIRVGGQLAVELAQLARLQNNTVSSVAKALIHAGLEQRGGRLAAI